MKLKLILVVALLMSTFAAAKAHAACSLAISPSSFIPRGQDFSLGVQIWDFSPLPPNPAFTIVFFGLKNGVVDTPPGGEQYPGVFGFGSFNLTGFQNPPSGGLSGEYVRYAFIYDRNGSLFCVSNAVVVTLQ